MSDRTSLTVNPRNIRKLAGKLGINQERGQGAGQPCLSKIVDLFDKKLGDPWFFDKAAEWFEDYVIEGGDNI